MRIYCLWVVFILGFFLTGCGPMERVMHQQSQNPSGEITVENYTTQGNPRRLTFHQPPQRVIAVWQNSVETLLALGLKDHIVAALGVPSSDCIKEEYRADYESLPLIQFQLLDTEHVMLLQPDFILGWASTFTDKYIRSTDFWNCRGVQTYIARSSMQRTGPAHLEDEYQYILDLGKIFDCEARAEAIVKRMEEEIAFVQQATKNHDKPRTILMEVMRGNLVVYGHDTLAGDIVERVNGELIDPGRMTNNEELVAENPEVIFLIVSEDRYSMADKVRASFCARPAMQDVAAVRNGRVYVLPLFMVYSSATRTYDGICQIAAGLYPQLYEKRVPVREEEDED